MVRRGDVVESERELSASSAGGVDRAETRQRREAVARRRHAHSTAAQRLRHRIGLRGVETTPEEAAPVQPEQCRWSRWGARRVPAQRSGSFGIGTDHLPITTATAALGHAHFVPGICPLSQG
ncbi:hypothetical protein Cus16_2487 [Curtobacterium sp. ER1/6]|nr:hypothetical protein Cus16_2487 [Curtobacterium sp. ER1/6]